MRHDAAGSADKTLASYVEFIGVQKSYDARTVVIDDLNLSILRGEFITLLGPSGSGKTTTLMMLAGFEPVTRGQIVLDGRSIQNLSPNKRGIGMVFQNYALFPHMTVAQNVSFPLSVRGVSSAETKVRVDRVLGIVRLSGFSERYPGQLSGGQQQRVALARALVFEPALVLMDEPLGALDRTLRERMQYEIKHIHHTLGVTILYVTHDQIEALTMSTRIAVFSEGRIQQVGTPTEIYETPKTSFVSRFVGESNAFYGKVTSLSRSSCEVELDSGETVRAQAVNVGAVGDRTLLSLRPERVITDPDPDRVPNRFDGHILETIYLGDHIRIRLDVCENKEFMIKIANIQARPAFQVGSTIKVGWLPEDCRALDVPA